jgi:ATP-independent RNA helicase DbpA
VPLLASQAQQKLANGGVKGKSVKVRFMDEV